MSVITPRQKVTHASAVTYCRTVQSFATQMMPKPLKQLLCEPCITLSSWLCAFVCVFGGGVYELFCNCSEMVLKCFKSDWIELLLLLSLLSLQSDKRNKLSAQGSGCSLICSPKHLSQQDLHLVRQSHKEQAGFREEWQRRTREREGLDSGIYMRTLWRF